MHGGVDHHRLLVRVNANDVLVHVEEVAVLLLDDPFAQLADPVLVRLIDLQHVGLRLSVALDRRSEIQVNGLAGLVHTEAGVTTLLRRSAGHVARYQVAERRIPPLEVVVTIILGDVLATLLPLLDRLRVLQFLRHPDTAVVAERFAHERELALVVSAHRDAGRVDLRIARVAEVGAAFVCLPDGGDVAAHGVRAQEEHVAVAAGAEQHRMCAMPLEFAGDQVAGDDAARLAVHDHHVHHLVAVEHLHGALAHLAHQRAVGAEQQLLTGLSAGIERTAHLDAAEGAVIEQPTVVAGEGNTLRHALVDDVRAHFRQAVHVRLTRAVVATLHGVVEQTVGAIAVVLVVLRRVDATLRGDAVRTTRAILVTEGLYVVAHLGERRRGRTTGKARTHHDHIDAALVGRRHDTDMPLVEGPLLVDGAGRDLAVELAHYWSRSLKWMAIGMAAKKAGTTTLKAIPQKAMNPL